MPENSGFYHAAYAVATVIYVLYAVVLTMRRKRVRAVHAVRGPG